MADMNTKFLSLAGLTHYDEKIKAFIANADLAAIATAQGYTDQEVKKVQDAVDLINNADNGLLAQAKAYTDQEVEAAVEEINKLIGALPEGTTAKSVIEYIDLKTANIASDETVNALTERVTTAEGAISALEAKDLELVAEDERLAGLITAEETRAKGEEKKNADAIAAEVERATGIEGGLRTDVDAIKGDYLKGADKTELSDAIAAEKERAEAAEKANSDAIAILNGDGVGSVTKTVDDAINKFATDITNDDVVNSYKELIDWVAEHGPEAAEMADAIVANEKSISDLEKFVGTLPEGETSATIVAFIQKLVSAEESRATEAEGALDERIDNIEAIVGTTADGKTVAEQISEAVAGVQANVDELEETVNTKAAQADLEAATGRITTAEGEIDQLQTDVDAVEAAVATKAEQSDLDDTTLRVSNVEGDVSTLQGRVDSVEGSLSSKAEQNDLLALGTDVVNVSGKVDGLETRMSGVESKASDNELAISGHDTRIGSLELVSHTHDNKDVLDGITSGDVEAWSAAEQNANDYADDLNTAMNTRVEAVEATSHTHTDITNDEIDALFPAATV